MSRLLECLKTDILVADGAMGTLLYANGLDNCYEAYNLTHPDNISAILPMARAVLAFVTVDVICHAQLVNHQ